MLFANSGDPDQTLHSAVSNLGLHIVCQLPFWGSPDYNGVMSDVTKQIETASAQ